MKRRYKIKQVDLGYTYARWDVEPTGYYTFCIFRNYGCLGWGFVRMKAYPPLYDHYHYKADAEKRLVEKRIKKTIRMETWLKINSSYWKMQRLLSLHFDVFGLIEKRLAIDINTITHLQTM